MSSKKLKLTRQLSLNDAESFESKLWNVFHEEAGKLCLKEQGLESQEIPYTIDLIRLYILSRVVDEGKPCARFEEIEQLVASYRMCGGEPSVGQMLAFDVEWINENNVYDVMIMSLYFFCVSLDVDGIEIHHEKKGVEKELQRHYQDLKVKAGKFMRRFEWVFQLRHI